MRADVTMEENTINCLQINLSKVVRYLGTVHMAYGVVAFSSRARILEKCSTIHSPLALFFTKVEISFSTLIPLFTLGLVHSGSAS